MNPRQATAYAVLTFLIFQARSGLADESHPGLGLEALYAQAALAYDRHEIPQALGLLGEILKTSPNDVQALELQGLALKDEGNDKAALQVYVKLLKLKHGMERGPYFFEAALIYNREGDFSRAQMCFQDSIALGFNVSASHLFLGIIRFGHAGNPKQAEADFEEVKREGLPEMRVVAHYYLGMIYLKEGYPARGSQELVEARQLAGTIPGNETAADTAIAVNNMLGSFAKGQWFGNIALLAQYDSNISEVPGSSSIESQASYRATSQSVISAGVGYMSPAVSTFQFIPSYQFGYNYNFNTNTKEYEYGSNVTSLYINYKPLDEMTGGLKLQGNFTFSNEPENPSDLSGSYSLSKYSLAGDIGPYFKMQLSPWMRLEAEAGLRPQIYYTETELSGTSYYAKTTLRAETRSAYLNPGASVGYENDSTNSDDYKYRDLSLSVFDVLRLTMRDTITLALDFIYYDYYATSWRRDTTFNPHLSVLHMLSPKWSLIGDLGYTTNGSTMPTSYSYNRWVVGAGASYAF